MLKRFSEITMKDVITCGGKGASLGEMMNAGLPIPNGFVLTTKAYGKNSNEWENEVLQAFDKLDTKFVAVRSSGTKEDGADDSFAGQFDTYLFITRENLIEKIKECHDSVNSERIVSYCEYKGIDIKSIKVAIVVQKMINSESAGVCFTANPVSQNYDEIMIDAGFGVGEAVVSGMITPDNYIVNKKTGEIKKIISQQEKKLVLSDKGGTKEVKIPKEEQENQKLSDKHIHELVELAKKIEKHYGKPMDTERAIENGKLFILQARPITTLGTKNENLVYKFLSSITKTENLLPPITSSSIFVQTCLDLYPRYLPNYINDNSSMNGLTLHHKGKTYTYVDGTKLINIANTVIQLFFSKKLTENNILKNFNKHTNQIDNNYKLYNYDYLNNLSNKELIELAEETINYFMEFDSTSLFSIMIDEDFLQNHFSIISKKNGLQKDFYKHASNIPILSFDKRQIEDIVSCIKDGGLNKKNLEKLQYLGTSYSKYTTLEDMEDFLLNNYGITTDFAKNETIKLKKEKERVEELKKKYNERYLTLTPQQQLLASFISMSIKFRDKRKNYTLKAICTISRIMEIFFDKNGLDKKYLWNIGFGEILLGPDYILGLKDKLSLREEGSVFFSDYNQQKLLVQEGYEAFADAFEKVQSLYNTDTQGNTIQGISGSSGKAKGVVKVIQFLDKDNQFQDGDILVTGMTRPEFVPLMKKASAIITDEGGITCHAAIISRELGIPCVIGTKIATQVLKDGDIVEVDADNGIVKILENKINGNNLELKIGNKIFTPEFRSHPEVYFNYQAYPFFTSIFAKCYSHKETKWTTPCFYITEFNGDGHRAIQYCTGSFIEKGKNMIDDLLSGGNEASKFLGKNNKLILNCFDECKKYLKNKSGNFLEIWDKIGTAFSEGWHIFNFSYAMQEYLNKLKIDNPELFEKISSNIIAPEKSFINEAEDYLIELCKKYPKNFDRVYEMFMEEYGRFQNSYLGINKKTTKSWLKEFYEKIKNNNDSNNKDPNKLTDLPKKYKGLVETASRAVCYQDNKKRLGSISYIIMENWLREISKEIKVSFDDLLWLTVEEILSYDLKSKTDIKRLKERIMGYKKAEKRWGIMTDKGYSDIDESFRLEVAKLNNKEIDGNTIHGVIGNKGKITGRARIVINVEKDAGKVNEGDILVTGMTRPEFVPIMRKAGAFITDEGGVTCHAAIISRELGKPCIIGTKIATQVLKDGDLVEVDADNGIVSILENTGGERGIGAVNNNDLNKKFNELKKYNQRDIQTFNAYPFFINSVATVSAFNLLPYDLHYTQILCEYENDTVKWHYDVKDYENLGKIFWGKCKNTTELLKLIDKYDIDYKQSKKEFDKALSIYKKNKLEENRTRLLEKSIQFLACGAGSAHILECASYYAEKYFTKGKIITPHDESFLSKAHKLAKNLKSENDLNKAHKEFLKEYGWIKNTYMGRNTISIQEFSDLADEKDLKFTSPKYKKNSIEEMISYTFNRQDRRKENIFKAIDKVDDVLKIISKDTGISKKSLSYMLPSEVSKIDNKNFQKELENRRLYFIDYTTKNEHYYSSQKFENLKNNERLSDLKEIKGSIGNPGKIIGTARVCQNLESIKNFNEGDILVTSMTRPEFITAMRKASAFVTDEGGITCHAAIISRELGKPCIIGTKIATKVLKDGDLVEVDADNGIVSILKKQCDISNLGNSSDYIRMFQTLYLPFINAYILNSYYKKLGVLSIYRNDTRTCYIPKDSMTETLKEGKIIYTDNDNYDTFIKKFELYKNSTISKYENIMNEKNLNIEKIKKFLYSLPTFFEFYSKTEFFYTDSLFSPQQTEKEREKFLKIVENVKNPGREFFNKLLFGEQSMLNQLLTKISQKTGIGKESLFLSTFEEIVGYINNSKPNQETLNNRKIGYVLKGNGDNIELFYGDIAREYSKTFYDKSKNEKILKGRIANPGKTIGKVKIFKYNYKTFDSIHKTIESMNIGDILVAETTSPELILACKKAGAIITNQGGMMSHAAIVSRELNIPCIVGVNNATEILLDGMIVEVDANKGEVKIM